MNTLRADINKLVTKGTVNKVYGGVQLNESVPIVTLEAREARNMPIKRKLCKEAAEFIRNDDVVYIDAGSTAMNVIDYVDPAISFTVVTNSLPVMLKVSKLDQISLICLYGKYQRETGSFVSLDSHEAIRKFNINTAFMCAAGIASTGEFTISQFLEYGMKSSVIQQSAQTIMLADSDKIGVPKLLTFATLNQIHYFITDSNAPKYFVDLCKKQNVSILTVSAD